MMNATAEKEVPGKAEEDEMKGVYELEIPSTHTSRLTLPLLCKDWRFEGNILST